MKIYLYWHTYVTEFSNYYRKCADLLRSHKNAKTNLHEITLEEFRLYCLLMKFYQDKNYVLVVKAKCFLRKKKMRMQI